MPRATYASSPNECAYAPAGKSPSANCNNVIVASGFMAMLFCDRIEYRTNTFPRLAEPVEQLEHRRVVGHQQLFPFYGEGKMVIADLERNAQRSLIIARPHREHGLFGRFDLEVPSRLVRE